MIYPRVPGILRNLPYQYMKIRYNLRIVKDLSPAGAKVSGCRAAFFPSVEGTDHEQLSSMRSIFLRMETMNAVVKIMTMQACDKAR